MPSEERSISEDTTSTHTMGRTPSSSPAPENGRSKSPKTSSDGIKKKTPQKNSILAERLHDISPEEFVRFFHLPGDRITVYVGTHMPGYSLPRKLMSQKSGYFNEEYQTSKRFIYQIDFEAKEAFDAILQYIFTDKITLPDYQSQMKPSKAITKYLDIIKMSTLLQLDSDLLARNAATAVWTVLRNHPSKIRNKHLKVIFDESWPEGWAYSNVRKEFVKEMAEEWIDVTVGVNTKERKYDLEGILKKNGEISGMVLKAVGELLKRRSDWTGIHPLTGNSLFVAGDRVVYQEEIENAEENAEENEEEDEEEFAEFEEEEEDVEMTEDEEFDEQSSPMLINVSESGRWWEVSNKN